MNSICTNSMLFIMLATTSSAVKKKSEKIRIQRLEGSWGGKGAWGVENKNGREKALEYEGKELWLKSLGGGKDRGGDEKGGKGRRTIEVGVGCSVLKLVIRCLFSQVSELEAKLQKNMIGSMRISSFGFSTSLQRDWRCLNSLFQPLPHHLPPAHLKGPTAAGRNRRIRSKEMPPKEQVRWKIKRRRGWQGRGLWRGSGCGEGGGRKGRRRRRTGWQEGERRR